MLVMCVLQSPVVLLGLNTYLHQKIGKLWHVGDRLKAFNEPNQTITFNLGASVGSDEILMNLDCLWRYLA
jgi:hypothetical protein